jgi:glutaredoxin-like protein NrdH
MTEIGMVHVEGKNAGNLVLYTLSTCGWCRKAKEFLNELGVAYDYVDTDLLAGKEKDIATKEIQKWNPRCSFPTLVINDRQCIVGFDKNGIREALKA